MQCRQTPTHLKRASSSISALSTKPPPSSGAAIGRSHSFADFGVGPSRRPPRKMGSPGEAWSRPVLGDLLRSPKLAGRKANLTLGGSTTPSAKSIAESFKKAGLKLPKVPRPQRTVVVFHSLKRGIRECVQATEEDILNLRINDQAIAHSTAQARSIELEKQIRAAERYRKRLEFHLAKIEELEEQYFIHNQLREGVKNMAKAYVHHTGNSKRDSLTNVKTGFKECTQIMCAIEAQAQNLMGTFHCQMKGLLGFARLMPGDVYDISVRHGHQKWKSRGRIADSGQTWQNDKYVFKALLNDLFDVKAVEVKLLSKHSMLGQKRCDTKDLFSANPQMMTVGINPHGTIKMSIFVTWNPLEGVEEGISVFEPLQRSQSSLKRSNYPVIEGYRFSYINGQEDTSSMSGSECSSPSVSSLVSPSSPDFFRSSLFSSSSAHSDLAHLARPRPVPHSHRPVSVAVMDTISESSSWDVAPTTDFGVVKPDVFDTAPLLEALQSELARGSLAEASNRQSDRERGLEETLQTLKATLEDYQGQHCELQKLEEQIRILYRMVVKGSLSRSSCSSRASTGSITIETALEAFDFLESDEYFNDGNSRRPSLDQLEDDCTLSPKSTTKTADSGIESIANRLSEDQSLEMSFTSSPEPLSTGNEQVDVALLWHLSYCERLLENLGNFGPLKCREIYSLDRLRRQADILEKLVAIARDGPNVGDLQQVMSDSTKSKDLRQFWVRCVDGPVLYTPLDRFLGQLERSYGDVICDKYDVDCRAVVEVFLARVLDLPIFDAQITSIYPNITMHQLITYISEERQCELREYFMELAGEVWLNSRLKSGITDIIIKTMLTFKKEAAPPSGTLRIICLLLIIDNSEVRRSAASYLRSLNMHPEVRQKVMVVYLESLEDKNPDMRSSACIALRLLQASEALDQLVYLSQSDSSSVVKHMAKDALISFGDIGRKAYEDSQLTSHGFQGVKVHL